jgi:hypothetical protein
MPFGFAFDPVDCVEALALPPSRSLVPLACELHGFCIPCWPLALGPPGPFGEVAGCSWVCEFGVLVWASAIPPMPSENAAARSRYFIRISSLLVATLNRSGGKQFPLACFACGKRLRCAPALPPRGALRLLLFRDAEDGRANAGLHLAELDAAGSAIRHAAACVSEPEVGSRRALVNC